MRIIIVEGGKRPYEAELEHDLKSMRRCVGGDIEAVYEPGGRGAALICNDEGTPCGKETAAQRRRWKASSIRRKSGNEKTQCTWALRFFAE